MLMKNYPVDGDRSIDVGDLTYLVGYWFKAGPAPTLFRQSPKTIYT